jgi:hypothetical protein
MNSQAEIYAALLAGETLISEFGEMKMKLVGGKLKCINKKLCDNQTFQAPENWHIYKKPEWYENIPEGGVLCKVWDYAESVYAYEVIKEYRRSESDYFHYFKGENANWKNAQPLTKQEIQVFLNNVPEGE